MDVIVWKVNGMNLGSEERSMGVNQGILSDVIRKDNKLALFFCNAYNK